jgi:hypothetical protein
MPVPTEAAPDPKKEYVMFSQLILVIQRVAQFAEAFFEVEYAFEFRTAARRRAAS